MNLYAITDYSPSAYTVVTIALVSAESMTQAWQRFVDATGYKPRANDTTGGLAVSLARPEHIKSGAKRY